MSKSKHRRCWFAFCMLPLIIFVGYVFAQSLLFADKSATPSSATEKRKDAKAMDEDEAREVWARYDADVKQRRLEEASRMHEALRASRLNDTTTPFTLSYKCFGTEEVYAGKLADVFAEYDETHVLPDADGKYWWVFGCAEVEGTDKEKLLAWVEYVCDVANANGLTFSSWKIEYLDSKKVWDSQDF